MNTELNTEPVDTVRVIKTANCPSLSERSTLSYKIGSNPDIQFRVCGNTGGGFFNDEWVPLSAIQKVINKMPKGVAFWYRSPTEPPRRHFVEPRVKPKSSTLARPSIGKSWLTAASAYRVKLAPSKVGDNTRSPYVVHGWAVFTVIWL